MTGSLNNFDDFLRILFASGFSIGGGNDESVYAIVDYDWLSIPPGSPIVWHTGDPETDPWEWRIRVLNERDDIAYAKCFSRSPVTSRRSFTHSSFLHCVVAAWISTTSTRTADSAITPNGYTRSSANMANYPCRI